jgi:hypothetical protein
MRIAAISGVKNESDIIESFVRQNGRLIDDFYFIDDSVDRTPQILQLMVQEGFRLLKIDFDTRDYQHSKVMTNATRLINADKKYDWIFYLDADEIIYCETRSHLEQILTANASATIGVMRHLEYASNGSGYFNLVNPLKEGFNLRSVQTQTKKIFIRGNVSDQIVIGPGQHDAALTDGRASEYFESGLGLAHFPVRSPAQYATRTIIIYANLVAKLNKIPNEGHHAVRQYEWLKARGFDITNEEVTEWGLKFGLDEKTASDCRLTLSKPELLGDISCTYHDLCRRNETLLLALELERVSGLLSDFRHKTHDAIANLRTLF